jgi:hypothetical protein
MNEGPAGGGAEPLHCHKRKEGIAVVLRCANCSLPRLETLALLRVTLEGIHF